MILLLSALILGVVTRVATTWASIAFGVLLVGEIVLGVFASIESRKLSRERAASFTPAQAGVAATSRTLARLFAGFLVVAGFAVVLAIAFPSIRVCGLVVAGILSVLAVLVVVLGRRRIRRQLTPSRHD